MVLLFQDKGGIKPHISVSRIDSDIILESVLNTNQSVNPLPNKPWFLRVCRTSLLETLWETEKLLITSNFSFSHSVF